MSSPAFTRQLTVTASTKRPPAPVNGKRGAPVAHLATVSITPLTAVSIDTATRIGLDTPYNLLQAFAEGDADIADGDDLTPSDGAYAGREMPVKRVVRLSWGMQGKTERLHIILENLRR